MIRVVGTFAGLGNQMYQYALFLRLLHDNNATDKIYLKVRKRNKHSNIMFFDVFDIDIEKSSPWWVRILFSKQIVKYSLPLLKGKKITDADCTIDNLMPCISGVSVLYYYGFWQDFRILKPIEEEIREVFSFDRSPVSTQNRNLAHRFSNEKSVSIHVRRGDYVGHPTFDGVCTVDYYKKAIAYMKEVIGDDIKFYVFTDDSHWVKENLGFCDFILVDSNRGKDSWQDMYLMSNCRHNIIANSSFSRWAAWLNTNPDKIIIAPDETIQGEQKSIKIIKW